METNLEMVKSKLRNWVYSIIFGLYSNNRVKRESIVLGIIIGYINPNATRSAIQYLISDMPKNAIDESMVVNGVLMSNYLLPHKEDSKELCCEISKVDPNNAIECKYIKTTFLSRILNITNNMDMASIIKSLNIVIKNNKKLSNIAI